MRDINTTALAEINRNYGLEAINIVRVYWDGINPTDYSDKREGLEAQGLLGKVLEITGLDNIVSLDRSTSSTSINISLDDSDGSLRTLINSMDIHKKRVDILQWFVGGSKADAFVLFSGEINTPMDWQEGARTLNFTVVNLIENIEFGFSLDEGIMQGIPVDAYGKSFPVVFGTVFKVPSLMLGESPSGILAQGFAWVFKEEYEDELQEISDKMSELYDLCEALYAQHIGLEIIASLYNNGDIGVSNDPPDNYDTYLQYHQASIQAYQQYLQYSDEYRALGATAGELANDYEAKKVYARRTVFIASQNFPRGVPVVIEINNSRFTARFDGIVMSIGGLIEPPDPKPASVFHSKYVEDDVKKTTNSTKTKEKFRWFDAGSKIRVISVPIYYAAAYGGGCQILNVYAKKDNVRVPVPRNMYDIVNVPFVAEDGRSAIGKIVRMRQPLTTLYDLNQEQLYESDDIWCDVVGEIPGNFITILQWTIARFTNLVADPVTFGLVATQTVFNPMNFAVLERKNTLDFLKDICFQARTAIWLQGRLVKLRYLAVEPNYVEVITPDDVLQDTLIMTCDDTEQVITKIVANWKYSLDQEKDNKVILRTNVLKYGVREEEYDYFAYQQADLVYRSAAYWSIRYGNLWKKIKFTTHIGKLKLEAQDGVLMSGFNNMFAAGDVIGIVEQATFDSTNNSVQMEVWLPIRWGEMTKYRFAYPAAAYELYGVGPEFATGNPFEGVQDVSGLMPQIASTYVSYNAPPYPSGPSYIYDQPPLTFSTSILEAPINFGRPPGIETANNRREYEFKVPKEVTVDIVTSDYDMGYVRSAMEDGFTYNVELFSTGKLVKAQQLLIAEGWKVVEGTPVYLLKKRGTWYMQAPTWQPEETN